MKTLTFENSEKLYFTSDLHLGHENIIPVCNRPYKSVDEMDKALIDNWNSVIKKDDTVFLLGDFCWRMGSSSIAWYTKRLIGNIILILGNHDKSEKPLRQHIPTVYDGFVNIKVKDSDDREGHQRITLCHYPMLSWYQSHRGAWQLFGHWHNVKVTPALLKDRQAEFEVKEYVKEEHLYMERIRRTQYDVGVDGNDYTPISYQKIKEIINKNLDNSK